MSNGAQQPSERIRALLRELREGLAKIYGDDLEGLFLFGSYARGDERPGSDLDVVAVLSAFEDLWTEIKRTSALVADLSLKHGVTVALQMIRRSEWQAEQDPLILNIREEGVAA